LVDLNTLDRLRSSPFSHHFSPSGTIRLDRSRSIRLDTGKYRCSAMIHLGL
jgi:hypothetical protein